MQKLLQEARNLRAEIVTHTEQHCHIQIMGVTVNFHDAYISQGAYILCVEHQNIVSRPYEVPCDEAHLQEIVTTLQAQVDAWT